MVSSHKHEKLSDTPRPFAVLSCPQNPYQWLPMSPSPVANSLVFPVLLARVISQLPVLRAGQSEKGDNRIRP
jgi:hypothetical protein